MDTRKDSFMERAVECWNGLPRKVESPFLEVFTKQLGVALRATVLWIRW